MKSRAPKGRTFANGEAFREWLAEQRAWKFFSSQAPWYQRTSIYWVMSAKKEETREKRLATLKEYSAKAKPIPQLDRTKG